MGFVKLKMCCPFYKIHTDVWSMNQANCILIRLSIYNNFIYFLCFIRWCPAPDCSFAVIASECASCPKLRCERPGCHSYFCYHCKAEWHPNQTCDAARAQRSPNIRSSSVAYSQDSQHSEYELFS